MTKLKTVELIITVIAGVVCAFILAALVYIKAKHHFAQGTNRVAPKKVDERRMSFHHVNLIDRQQHFRERANSNVSTTAASHPNFRVKKKPDTSSSKIKPSLSDSKLGHGLAEVAEQKLPEDHSVETLPV